MQKKNYR